MQPSLDHLPNEIKKEIILWAGPESIKKLRLSGREWEQLTDSYWVDRLKKIPLFDLVQIDHDGSDNASSFGVNAFYKSIPRILKLKVVLAKGVIEADFRLYCPPFKLNQHNKEIAIKQGCKIPPEQEFCRIDPWHKGAPADRLQSENWTHHAQGAFWLSFKSVYPKEIVQEAIDRGSWWIKGCINTPNGFKNINIDLKLSAVYAQLVKDELNNPPQKDDWHYMACDFDFGDAFRKRKIVITGK